MEAILKRKGIERKFGEAKKRHGLDTARYRRRARVAIQVFMTLIALNVKRTATLSYQHCHILRLNLHCVRRDSGNMAHENKLYGT